MSLPANEEDMSTPMDIEESEQETRLRKRENSPYYHDTGRAEDDEEKDVEKRLEEFRELMDEYRPHSPKFDLVALKMWRTRGYCQTKPQIGYHPPGVYVGRKFQYRVELIVSGVHTQHMSGIDYWRNNPCNAIVLAGRYEDDQDEGHTFTYSGEGRGNFGGQDETQLWTKGNSALRLSHEKQTPVKVVRCISDDPDFEGQKSYVYDGLYLVTGAWTEQKDKRRVCVFSFKGIPREHIVSTKVQTGDLYHGPKRMIFNQPKRKREEKEVKCWGHASTGHDLISLEVERISFFEKRGNVLCQDISGGKEAVAIPLINDTGTNEPLPDMMYVTSLDHTTEAAEKLIQEARRHDPYTGCRQLQRQNYDDYGSLKSTLPEGIRECPLSCLYCNNSIVATGIRYPLEVFMTENKGWGVRCSVDIPSGAFVCEYTGEILTDEEAEQRVQMRDSTYLYSLDHFYLLKRSALMGNQSIIEEDMPKLPMSDEDIKAERFHGRFLVIDAKYKGNVGRFLNHACYESANISAQMVLLDGCNGVFHHVGFFAIKPIPRYTELVHDYGWNKGIGKELDCKCKDPRCNGVISP